MDETTAAPDDKRWLRSELVAPWWEIIPVLCVMLGPFAWSAVSAMIHGANLHLIDKLMNTRALTRNTALEAGLLAAFLFYLRWRGWRPADFKIRIDSIGTLLAPPLAIGASLANIATALTVLATMMVLAPNPKGLMATLLGNQPSLQLHHVDLSWTIIVVGSVVNAYLEELTFMGYAFHQFAAKRGPLFALAVMIFLRMLLHTYKGAVGMFGIGAFAFIYGITYWQVRRLWVLILAHILTDIVALGAFKLAFSH